MVPAVELRSCLSTSDRAAANRPPPEGEAVTQPSENSKAMELQQ